MRYLERRSAAVNTMSRPTVQAAAWTARADAAAAARCVCAPHRSCGETGSMKARVPPSSGCPADLNTSCTMDGARPGPPPSSALRCKCVSHSPHAPLPSGLVIARTTALQHCVRRLRRAAAGRGGYSGGGSACHDGKLASGLLRPERRSGAAPRTRSAASTRA